MSKRTIVISFLLAGTLIGMSGCVEKTAKENPLEKKVARLEEQIQKDKKAREAEKEKEEQLKEEKKSVEVTVLDPQSKKVVKTLVLNSR